MADKEQKYDFSSVDELEKQYDFSSVDSQDKKEQLPKQEKGESSTLSDFGTGAHQGMTLGFADELGAVGKTLGSAAGDVIFGLPRKDLEGYLQEYRAEQQKLQDEAEGARKSSPWAYAGGNVLGGLIPGIATSPLAAAAPLKTATAAGALTGAGQSTETIEENPLGLAADVGIGGTVGAALQKVLPGGKPKPKKDILKRGEFIPQLEKAAQLGEEGISLSSKPEARQALTERLRENVSGLSEKFTAPRKQLGEALEETIKAGDQNILDASPMQAEFFDAIGDISSSIQDNIGSIGRKRGIELLQKLDDLKRGLLKPSEMNTLQKELSEVLSGSEIPQLRSTLKTGISTIRDEIEGLAPGYKGAAKDFAQYAEKGPEALLSRGFDPDVADVFLSDLKKGDLKIAEKIQSLVNGIRTGGKEGLQKQNEFFAAMKQLEFLAKENPELVKKIGIDPAKLTREFIDKADEAAVALKTAGKSLPEAGIERGVRGIRAIGEEAVLKGANKYGFARKKVKDFISSQKEDLVGYANALKEHGGPDLQAVGNMLGEAVQSGDIAKQNAAIFSIMQLPKAKQLLNLGDDE